MAGTGASVYLPPIAGQCVFAGGGLALPASGAWTEVAPTTSSDHTIKESGLYLVTADTRAAINVPAGGNVWVVGAIARNGAVIGGTEHLAHQIANTTVPVGTNEGSGTSFLVGLTAGDVLSMVACARGSITAAGAAASVIGNGDGYTRASWVRVRV
ncbi:hypothetical protein ABTX60_07265 [Streptomyces sp. NPDC126510]|uniref:hypothetical protein n=1 Tax=Streptomyces sp. NPDC126510 TaxID=3155317 RepID=UPI00331B7EDF